MVCLTRYELDPVLDELLWSNGEFMCISTSKGVIQNGVKDRTILYIVAARPET